MSDENSLNTESTEVNQDHYLENLGIGDGDVYPFDESGNYVDPTSKEENTDTVANDLPNDTQVETNQQDNNTATQDLDFYFSNQSSTTGTNNTTQPNADLLKQIEELKAQVSSFSQPQQTQQQPNISPERQQQLDLINYSANKMSVYLSRGATQEEAMKYVQQDINDAMAEYEKASAVEQRNKDLLERLERIENEKKYDIAYSNNMFNIVNTEKWGSNDNFMQAIQHQDYGVMSMLNAMFKSGKDTVQMHESQYNSEFNTWFKNLSAKDPSFLPELSSIVKAKKFMKDYPKLKNQIEEHASKRALNTKKGTTTTKGSTTPANTGVKSNNIDAELKNIIDNF